MTTSEPSEDELAEFRELDDDSWDRRTDEVAERHPQLRMQLPEDLSELHGQVGKAASLRKAWSPDEPWYVFEDFETYRCFIGGMGMVIEALDLELDRKVAIKFCKQSGPEAQTALLAEAKRLAKVSHPNVVTIYDTARWRERAYFVMEWIDGLDGQKWMATPRTWQEVRDVFVQAGQGLAAAHERGIQHRDFKLENMLIGNDGRVAVADFGISDSLRELENTDPRWGAPVGTPAYMAPERLRGERGDARSDQFSFCVAMHRGLYRLRPFAGEEPEELLEAIELGEVRADSRVDVPRWLSGVVRKGLAHDPDHRYRDMHELLTALRWPYFAIALVATAVAALALIWPVRSPAPEPPVSGETEVSPYEVILGLIATDEFAAAEEYWRKHKADLTDAEGLQLARACLARAKQLKPTDRTTANLAGYTGFTIAIHVSMFGKTSETQAEGRRLATEAVAIARADIATEISPYDVVLGLIATDEFLKAKRLWLEHASELSDAQQLKIADACLRRAIHLESADGTKAREAAAVAFQVATRVQHVGSAEEAESASRISSKAMAVGFEPGVRP